MKWLLLVYVHENAMTAEDREHCYVESAALTRDLDAQGKYLLAAPLQPVATAQCVRLRNNARLITDGPFAETHEQLGGFYLVEAKDRDEALAIAARIPPAKVGTIEVRPVLEIDGLPDK